MQEHFVEELLTYDGTQLSSLWGFRNFCIQGDSIISFRGPCRVDLPEMVDMEDVLKKSPIFSTD
ncbi:MAG: DUF366 family protein, partial [Firmicutes bacterium]|nr:DUF366 family protein [Bacillota bacterium]